MQDPGKQKSKKKCCIESNAMYKKNKNVVGIHNHESKEFGTEIEVKYGYLINALLFFSVVFEDLAKEFKKKMKTLKQGYWKLKK